MITIKLSDEQAQELKRVIADNSYSRYDLYQSIPVREIVKQINNQQFDVSDFESSRQYEALSVQNAGYLKSWDKATKK